MAGHSSKRKSVLVLTHNFPRYSGDMSGVFLRHLFHSLKKSADFTVLAPHDRGLSDFEEEDGISIHRFRYASDDRELLAYRGEMHTRLTSDPLTAWRFIRSYRTAAAKLARQPSFDLVWAHWWIPGGWIGMKTRAGKPLVVTCHGTDVFLLGKFRWLRRTAGRVFKAADRITVVSNFLKEQLANTLADRIADIERKIEVAPMPVDRRIFYYDDSIKPAPGSIVSASRLTPQKHLDKLIQAAARLQHDGMTFTIDIYGDGPERERLNGLIAESHLTDSIRIHTPIAQVELANRYRRSQIAILASEREGFGLGLLESMLCGCAGIGARSGGITDIIERDGEDGVLVTPGDVDSLYRSLKDLLANSDKLEKTRETCRESAETRFSDEVVSAKFQAILQDV